MRTALTWYVLLLVTTMVVPYIFGVAPRSPQQWRLVSLTIAFLTWLLLGVASLRSM